MNKEGE